MKTILRTQNDKKAGHEWMHLLSILPLVGAQLICNDLHLQVGISFHKRVSALLNHRAKRQNRPFYHLK